MAGVLITGFEPFGGETVNPSWEVVKQLDGMIIRGQQVVAKQLPCVFGEALTVLKAALETYQPRLTIAVGQAGGRVDITVERVAIIGVVDTALLAQNALTAAESLGLGGVYIGGLRNSIEAVTELLELPQHVLPLFGLCLGWPADNPDIKPRMPAAMLVHENRYQPLDNALLGEYDEQLAHYYLSRGSNARRDTWSDHIRRTIVKESRPFILDYLHKQGWATR